MDLNNKIIGIGGNARSGKDTLGENFKKILSKSGVKAETFSFADELKRSVDEFLLKETGISAFTEDTKEKQLIRPFLVCWGSDIMRNINDSVWIERLEPKLSDKQVNIITDMRFMNEFYWVDSLKGLTVMIHRDGIEPANHYEEINNKEMSEKVTSNFHVGDFEDNKLLYLTANEILDTLLDNETFTLWKATCH